MKKLLFIQRFWDKQQHKQWILFGILLISLLLAVYHTGTIVKSVLDSNRQLHLTHLQTNVRDLSAQYDERQQEFYSLQQEYNTKLSRIIPQRMASDTVTQIIDKLVFAVEQDITLNSVVYQGNKIATIDTFTVHPVEASFHISKESLSKLLHLLSQAGEMDEQKNNLVLSSGETFFVPLITLENIFIEGDMGDQYDETGTKLRTFVTAKLLLHFYSQS